MESFLIPPFFISTSISPIPSHTGYGKRHGAPRLNVFPHLIAYPEIDTIGIRLLFCPSIQTGGKRGCFSMNQFGLVGFPYNARWITYFPDSRKWRGHFPWVWKQLQKRIPAVFLFWENRMRPSGNIARICVPCWYAIPYHKSTMSWNIGFTHSKTQW